MVYDPNMRLIAFCLIAACAAQCQEAAPFACNLKVFQPVERKQHQALTHQIMAAATTHAVPQGYSFQIDSAKSSLLELAEWAGRERKCCPFFNIQLSIDGDNEGKLTLTITGREGVKEFIRAEFEKLVPNGM
jgi:hypothetical protein